MESAAADVEADADVEAELSAEWDELEKLVVIDGRGRWPLGLEVGARGGPMDDLDLSLEDEAMAFVVLAFEVEVEGTGVRK